jgi:two-component system OmpR family response regulator/two-component system response regulator RstA
MNSMTETIALERAGAEMGIRVLLIEDDADLCAAISDYLGKQGIAVLVEGRGDRALARISEVKPDLVILDVMLPGKDGFDVCRELRASGANVPVIILTAKEEDFDQVLGLELGADDYLAKPVQPRVLLARIKAITRRMHTSAAAASEGEVLQFGRLRIHGPNREVTLAEHRIELSPAEFDLLWLLANNAGKVMQRNDILKSLRGLHYSGADRSVDARLYRLRRRFGSDKEASWKIKTVRPHGYMFCLEPW